MVENDRTFVHLVDGFQIKVRRPSIVTRTDEGPDEGSHNADLNEGNKKPVTEPRPRLGGRLGLASRRTGFGLGHLAN